MLPFALSSIFVFVMAPWGLLTGKPYRRPIMLVLWGLSLALYGAWISHGLSEISSNKLINSILTDLSLSSTLISFTIAATGGSLIASGIVIRTQQLHDKESKEAIGKLNSALNQLEAAENLDEKLRNEANSLNNEDFLKHYKEIKKIKRYATLEIIKLKYTHKDILS